MINNKTILSQVETILTKLAEHCFGIPNILNCPRHFINDKSYIHNFSSLWQLQQVIFKSKNEAKTGKSHLLQTQKMQYSESPWLPQFLEHQSHFIHWDVYIQSWKLDQPPLEQMLCNFYHSDFCPFTQKKTTIYTFSVLTTYNQIIYQTQLKNKIWVKIAQQSPPHNRDRYTLPVSNQMLKHY